jgi:membrane protease YdiL (CAAX protease family)
MENSLRHKVYPMSKIDGYGYVFRFRMILLAVAAVCVFECWIPAVVKTYGGDLTATGVRTFFAFGIVFYACLSHSGHRTFPLLWRWSWIAIIPLLAAVGNTITLMQGGLSLIPARAGVMLVAIGLANASIEEFAFRGVAFVGAERDTPRSVVLISALGFSIAHFAGLTTGHPWQSILPVVIMALPVGLLFGIIRLSTGNILLPLIVHGLIASTANLAGASIRIPFARGPTISLLLLVASILLFCFHPAMKNVAGSKGVRLGRRSFETMTTETFPGDAG